jgi:hypothetical protein
LICTVSGFGITENELELLGKPTDSAKTPDGEYLVAVEVIHQLHCLVSK